MIMTEQTAAQLTEAELADLVISAVETFRYGDGPYLETEHRAVARKLGYNEERIARLWRNAADAASEQLAGMQAKLASVGARFDALRPKYEEAKRKLAESKVVVPLRRFNGPAPFLAPSIEPSTKDTTRKSAISQLIRRNLDNLASSAVPKCSPEPEQEPEEPEAPPEEAKPKAEARKPEAETAPMSALGKLYLPGVAGEVQSYFLESVMQPSHIMSLGVGLMVPTVLVSGYVFGPSGPKGCALQQTVIIVAPTSSGKQGAMDVTKECVAEAGEGARFLLGPNRFRSGAGLVRWVGEHRVSLCIQDEFGRLLAKFGDPQSNPSEIEINDRMREFWAIGPGGIYNSPHGAKKGDDSEMIVDPRLSIFGFGVHQEFFDACHVDDIQNGFY
jgi:hypothetical protein